MVPGDTGRSPPPKYRDKRTKRFAAGERISRFQAFERQAYKRLEILEAAKSREDLMALPSNRFEALGGNRSGQFSIRINQQWRICFEWPSGEPAPYNIEITDYH
jgi:proteic killer suppression protein